jgi:arylsulfatase A-like enzyme
VVIYGADNGLAIGRHGLFGKQNVYDHSVRVPLIVAGPGIPKGERRTQMVHLHDMCPTVLELAGVPVPSTVESRSLLPVIRDRQAQGREAVFSAYRSFQRAVRTREWKLIRYTVGGKTRIQLFNVAQDPEELHDLSTAEAQKVRIRELSTLLDKMAKEAGDTLGA